MNPSHPLQVVPLNLGTLWGYRADPPCLPMTVRIDPSADTVDLQYCSDYPFTWVVTVCDMATGRCLAGEGRESLINLAEVDCRNQRFICW
jgi:hypothetical protein